MNPTGKRKKLRSFCLRPTASVRIAVVALWLPLLAMGLQVLGATGLAWAAVSPPAAVTWQEELSQLPISFPVQSPDVAAYFQEMAGPADIASIFPAQLFLLPEGTPGQKMAAFRSWADAEQQLEALTEPVDMIMYNPEHWEYTPEDEQKDLVTTVRQFADLAHARGLRFMFAPDRRYAEEYLQQVAPDIDAVLLQGQQLQHDPQTFGTWVLGMARVGRTTNPEMQVFVQVGATRGTASEMYAALQTVADEIDGIAVWSLPRTLDILQELVTLVREGAPVGEATATSPAQAATDTPLPPTPEVPATTTAATVVPEGTDTPSVAPSPTPMVLAEATEAVPSPVPPAAVPQTPSAAAVQGLVTNILLFVGGIGIGGMLGFFLGWRLRP